MKKSLLLSVFAAVGLMAGAAGTAGTTVKVTNGYMELAIDGADFYHCVCSQNGNDLEYTVFNPDLTVKKSFTIKGVRNVPEGEGTYTREEYLDVSSIDMDDVIATRGLFTSDGKWCVVFRSGNYADYTDTNVTYSVYNEDGQKLFDLPVSREYYSGNEAIGCGSIFMSNVTAGKPIYVTVNEYDTPDENYIEEYTAWTFGASGINSPVASSTLKAYPNPLPSGMALTVDLPSPADNRTVFVVNDMKGRQVFRHRVLSGESVYRVSPRFARGNYVYTVIYGDGSSFTGKLAAE